MTDVVPPEDVDESGERVGAGLRRTYADSLAWIDRNRKHSDPMESFAKNGPRYLRWTLIVTA